MLGLIISWLCVFLQVVLFTLAIISGMSGWWFILCMLVVNLVLATVNTVIYMME